MKILTRIFTAAMLACLLLSLTACGDATTAGSNVSYTITVVDNGGNPVSGVTVFICQDTEGGVCYMPVKTDENGVAAFSKDVVPVQDNMKVRVLVADGYDLPLDENGDIAYTIIPNGATEMTLTLYKKA